MHFQTFGRCCIASPGTCSVSHATSTRACNRVQDLHKALDIAVELLPKFEELLQVPYSLPKLDLVAIPDFAAGAMENWGLITFKEADLLASNASGVLDEQRVYTLIAHEMLHMVSEGGDLARVRLGEAEQTCLEFICPLSLATLILGGRGRSQ